MTPMNAKDNALLAFWALLFSKGLYFWFAASVLLAREAWAYAAALLH